MVIDSHVHYTPPALKTWLEENADREPYWDLLLNAPRSIQGWVTADTMIDQMDAATVDQIVLVGEYWQQHASCVRRNDQVLDLMARFPTRIRGMAIVQPTAGDAALREVERCLSAGMIGVGELNPYAQNFTLTDPRLLAVAQLCQAHHVPINFHVGEEVGGYYLGKSTTPLRAFYQLACQFPDLKLIFAHWGGGMLFYELMPTVAKQLANVWYDTAASPLLYPTTNIFKTALTCIDPSKILYGSDYPLRLYPRRMKQPDFKTFLAEIESLNLGELDGILGENFQKMVASVPERSDVTGNTSGQTVVQAIHTHPDNAAVFDALGLPTVDQSLPPWETIRQAAAARGYGRQAQDDLLLSLRWDETDESSDADT